MTLPEQNTNNKLRVLELFAGIGACSKALERLGVEHEIVDAVEIDKYAIAAFNAIHGTNFAPQDITTWDKDIKVDLVMHGSPCQDFSIAGKNAGGDAGSGTRSSLMYETLRIVEKLKPKYVIWENVKNLVSKKHRHNFDAYLEAMQALGYTNHYRILNAKDFGVPQNRERIFTISILGGEPYNFPYRRPLSKRLKDVLEDKVDEQFYLSDAQVASFTRSTAKAKEKGNGFEFKPTNGDGVAHTIATRAGSRQTDNFIEERKDGIEVVGRCEDIKGYDQLKRIYGVGGLAPTLPTMGGGNQHPKIAEPTQDPIVVASRGRGDGWEQQFEARKDGLTNTLTSVQKDNYIAIKTANLKGYDWAKDGDGVDLSYPDSKTKRGRVGHGVAKTIPTMDCQGVVEGVRIRKLTPKECYRLMGFDDADYEKAAKVISKTQLYKTAGNSIVVNVLEGILGSLLWK